jgi:hypothetical protein
VPAVERAADSLFAALSAIADAGALVDATTATLPEPDDVGSLTVAEPLPSDVVTVPPLERLSCVLAGEGVAE